MTENASKDAVQPMRRSRRSSMAFQASLHGFPDFEGMRSSISESRRSVTMPSLQEVHEEVKEGEKESQETNTDSTQESRASIDSSMHGSNDLSTEKMKSEKELNKNTTNVLIDATEVTSDDKKAKEWNLVRKTSRSSYRREHSSTSPKTDDSLTKSGDDDTIPEERRTSLMMLFRQARGPKRRRSSMFQNMVSWMLKGQSDEEKVFAHVAQELERQQKYRMIITTDSKWKFRWNIFIGMLVLYNGVLIPWNISFGRPFDWTLFIDYSVDLFFLVDIFLSLRTSYITKTGVEVMNSAMIRKRYLRTWFSVDLISVIPFELLALILDRVNGRIFFSLLKVPRLLRLSRLMKQFDKFSNANILRLVKLLGAFILFAHWVACTWYFIGRYQREGNYWTGPVWLVEQGLCQTRNLNGELNYKSNVLACVHPGSANYLSHGDYIVPHQMKANGSSDDDSDNELNIRNHLSHDAIVSYADRRTSYITSLYWAFTTLTTVGYGDVVPSTNIERLFAMFVMLMGSVIYATIFGNVSLLVQNFDKQHARLRRALNQMSSLADFYNLSEPIRAKLRSYAMKYTYQVCGVDARRVLVELPQNFRDEILHEMHAPLLSRMKVTIPALLNCSSFLTELLHSSKACLVSMGDSVRVHCFVENTELFIVSEGLMHVIVVPDEQKDPFEMSTRDSKTKTDQNGGRHNGRRNADLLSPKKHSFHSYDMKINQSKDTPNGMKLMILGAGDIFWGAYESKSTAIAPCVTMLQAEVNCELLQISNSSAFYRNFPYEMKLLKKYVTERWMTVMEHEKSNSEMNTIPSQIEKITQQQQQQQRQKRRASHFHAPWRSNNQVAHAQRLSNSNGRASDDGYTNRNNKDTKLSQFNETLIKKRSLSVPFVGNVPVLSSEHGTMNKNYEKLHRLGSRTSTDSLHSFDSLDSKKLDAGGLSHLENENTLNFLSTTDMKQPNGGMMVENVETEAEVYTSHYDEGQNPQPRKHSVLEDKDSDDSSLNDMIPGMLSNHLEVFEGSETTHSSLSDEFEEENTSNV